jgi:uncharacterized protein (TIGR02145 family)
MNIDSDYNYSHYAVAQDETYAPQGVCPDGWHLPSDNDWDALLSTVAGCEANTSKCLGASTVLKASDGWNASWLATPVGTDAYGFSALPGGYFNGINATDFYNTGNHGYWWSSYNDNAHANRAYYRTMHYGDEDVARISSYKSDGLSVRCVKGEGSASIEEPSSSSSSATQTEPSSSSLALVEGVKIMGSFSPGRENDNETYKTAQIGDQVWMAENLNYRAGVNESDSTSWCYDNDPANCAIYGRLYDWATMMGFDASCNNAFVSDCGASIGSPHQGICPDGWHIPTNAEWESLGAAAGGSSKAGNNLKSTLAPSAGGWPDNDFTYTDSYGFSALPGGYNDLYNDLPFDGAGKLGAWWSTDEYDDESGDIQCYYWDITSNYSWLGSEYSYKGRIASVRCVKD